MESSAYQSGPPRYLRQQARAQIEARDLELINKAADQLNEEVEDVLRYQQTYIYRVHHPSDGRTVQQK